MTGVEKKLISIIDSHRNEILEFARKIERCPEPGFEEYKTAAHVAAFLRAIGLDTTTNIARTGVRADWKEQNGPNITIVGELDAIGCAAHPFSDIQNHTAHACGHHAQLTAMAGAALALSDPEVRASLCGSVSFFAIPAEEYVDARKRERLRGEGIIFSHSGKSEWIRLGEFDASDIILTTHVHMIPTEEDFLLGNVQCNGYAAENVTVRGKAAHAAINPWDGVNALHITTSAINMMNCLRETWREEDHVRLHNVIRKAGDVINSVPDEAVVETKIRASSLERIEEVLESVNRCYDGAAYAFGGKAEREFLQGYLPVRFRQADRPLRMAAEELGLSFREAVPSDFNNACTDVGDLTHLFPVINFTFGGFEGALHSPDFRITDEDKAYIQPAKLLALTVYRLLRDGAGEALQIKKSFEPVFSKEEYCGYIEKSR